MLQVVGEEDLMVGQVSVMAILLEHSARRWEESESGSWVERKGNGRIVIVDGLLTWEKQLEAQVLLQDAAKLLDSGLSSVEGSLVWVSSRK